MSRQAVSKWESCRGYPEIEKILYICNRYQVSLDELFSQEVPDMMIYNAFVVSGTLVRL